MVKGKEQKLKFLQVARQHTLGVAGYITWVLFTIYFLFQDKQILKIG